MKTTIEISDPLLKEARQIAHREKTSLRALVERGLRHVLQESRDRKPFKLRDGSVSGHGLQPEFRDGGWEAISRAIYEDPDE